MSSHALCSLKAVDRVDKALSVAVQNEVTAMTMVSPYNLDLISSKSIKSKAPMSFTWWTLNYLKQ